MPLTFGSLFTGIGGFDLGLERSGMVCRWQVEIDPYCRSILSRHWPDVPKHDDVRTFPVGNAEVWNVDLIAGGDPCQGNSVIGSVHKRSREDLASHFLRIVATLRPRIVLRENPSVSRPDAPWTWFRFRSGLESLGYAVVPFRVRSCCVGLDHRRDRLFLLASIPDADCERLQGIDWDRVEARIARGTRCNGRVRVERDDLSEPRFLRTGNGIPRRMDRTIAIGNAVPPPVAEWIGQRIIASLDNPLPLR
jgi:DNA (cytosine-5)-methyltransferase 1